MRNLLDIRKTRTTPYHPQSDGMVERFIRTLDAKCFCRIKLRDWDTHLPYVMMAYRSSEHGTTGATPNMLMLGRETSTPLEIIYNMPQSMKTLPTNQWVRELQERIENAHFLVRSHTKRAIERQKTYHDRKLSWDRFEISEEVYVLFPQQKTGCSPKLTSFWRGPFKIKKKVSDFLYEIDCRKYGQIQVVHCDRIRKRNSQQLRGEERFPIGEPLHDSDETEEQSFPDQGDLDKLVTDSSRPKRVKTTPRAISRFYCRILA